jgi:predicted MPP superfamily phosphohydrolase
MRWSPTRRNRWPTQLKRHERRAGQALPSSHRSAQHEGTPVTDLLIGLVPWPAYGDARHIWWPKLGILWASWLAWPLLVWWLWRLARRWRASDAAYRTVMLLFVALLVAFIDARFIERYWIVERTTQLKLGFKARLVLISDTHIGLYKSPDFLARAVARINAIAPDAVLIAGDITYEPDRPVAELVAPLKQLAMPAFSVPGNHDEESPGPPIVGDLRRGLQQAGVTPVEYAHARLKTFTLVGLGDHFADKDSIKPLTAAPRGKPIIVLMHNPDSAMQLKPGSAALALAGHTHGGQIRIPGLYERVIPTRHAFDRGLHTFPPVPTFVTSGLGEIGLPLRFLNPPVIDILEIE